MRKINLLKKIQNKAYKKAGQIPGTLIYTGEKTDVEVTIEVFDYNKTTLNRSQLKKVDDTFDIGEEDTVTWTNVNGLQNIADIQKLGEFYGLHPLLMEDIVDVDQRPKVEEFDDYIFLIAKMLYLHEGQMVFEHISFVLGNNFLITFQEAGTDVFDEIRKRLELGRGRVRGEGADYLMFALLDAITDHYSLVMENLGHSIEHLEEALFNQPDDDLSFAIQQVKKEALAIRRAIFPLKEVLGRLEKSKSPLLLETHRTYFKDLYDSACQVIDAMDFYREMIWGLNELYMSTINNKMNSIVKVLTIISTIFIPLTFIAGIYGMNFDYMPELRYKPAYFMVLGFMASVVLGMLYYFRRKRWL